MRVQRIATFLNHLCWSALGTSVITAFAFDNLWGHLWDAKVGRIVGPATGLLFIAGAFAAFTASSISLAAAPRIASSTRREAFIALGFTAFLLLLALWAPPFIDALERLPTPR